MLAFPAVFFFFLNLLLLHSLGDRLLSAMSFPHLSGVRDISLWKIVTCMLSSVPSLIRVGDE